MDVTSFTTAYSPFTLRPAPSMGRAETQNPDSAAPVFGDSLSAAISSDNAPDTKEPPQIAPPGGGKGVASDLFRLLGANTEGVNAASASNGQATSRESFFAELMRASGEQSPENGFAQLMHGMVGNAYSVTD